MTWSSLHVNLSQKTYGSSQVFEFLNYRLERHVLNFTCINKFLFQFWFLGYSGYMSPEYAIKGHFSMKSDVFSFGVIVLEIISGKKNTSFTESEDSLSLLGHVSMGLQYLFIFYAAMSAN